MDEKGFKDDIFERELGFIELIKRTGKILYFYRQPVLFSFFLFFIPVTVLLAIAFRFQLINDLMHFSQMTFSDWLFYFCQSLFQQMYFAASILFVAAFYEKKIFQAYGLISKILNRLMLFLLTYLMQFMLITAGMFIFILPGIVLAVFLSFSMFLVYSENLAGFDAFKESARTVRAFWFKVLFYYLILIGIEFAVNYGISHLFRLISFARVELKFFLESLLSLILYCFPGVFFAVLFYNLRQKLEPKDKNEEPAVD